VFFGVFKFDQYFCVQDIESSNQPVLFPIWVCKKL